MPPPPLSWGEGGAGAGVVLHGLDEVTYGMQCGKVKKKKIMLKKQATICVMKLGHQFCSAMRVSLCGTVSSERTGSTQQFSESSGTQGKEGLEK